MTVLSSPSLVVVSILPVVASGLTILVPALRTSNNDKLFHHAKTRFNVPLKSKLFGPEDESFNNGDFDFGQMQPFGAAENSSSSSGGAELAKDFFKELQQRGPTLERMKQAGDSNRSTGSIPITNMLNQEDIELLTSPPNMDLVTDSESRNGTASPVIRRKFTGRQDEEQPRSFFVRDQRSSSSVGQARTPREMMMEREYQLVRRAESGILGQAIVAVLALAFYIYIGLSGGIVSGRDAQMEDWGADDEIPFEQLMPVQRDREVSVWL